MQTRKPNLMGSIANLGKNFVVLAETRLQLLALDVQETGMNFLSLLILSSMIVTCFALALILATLLVVVVFWDSNRLLALGGATGFFAVAGIGLWLMVLARFRKMAPFFAATREEFAKDREWLSRDVGVVGDAN